MSLANKAQINQYEIRQRNFLARVAREASNNARENALSQGRSVTIQQGESIVKLHPDGKTDIIQKIKKSSVIPEKRRYCL